MIRIRDVELSQVVGVRVRASGTTIAFFLPVVHRGGARETAMVVQRWPCGKGRTWYGKYILIGFFVTVIVQLLCALEGKIMVRIVSPCLRSTVF